MSSTCGDILSMVDEPIPLDMREIAHCECADPMKRWSIGQPRVEPLKVGHYERLPFTIIGQAVSMTPWAGTETTRLVQTERGKTLGYYNVVRVLKGFPDNPKYLASLKTLTVCYCGSTKMPTDVGYYFILVDHYEVQCLDTINWGMGKGCIDHPVGRVLFFTGEMKSLWGNVPLRQGWEL